MSSITVPARATGTLTSDGTIPTATDTVTIGGVVYTFRASVNTTANDVLLGATAATAMQNLFDAINATPAKSGVTFGSLTVENPHVLATAVTATTVVVKARTPGAIGNFIATTEAGTHTSWGAATLASGSGSTNDAIEQIIDGFQIGADVAQALKELSDGGIAG